MGVKQSVSLRKLENLLLFCEGNRGEVAEWTIAPVFPVLKIWKRGRAVYGASLEN